MWSRIVTLIQKEGLVVLRDPRNRVALFLPPILQLFLFSTGTMEVKNVTLGIWNQDYGQVSNELIERLCASPNFVRVEFAHSRAELRQMVDDQRVMLAITFPPDFSRNFVGQRVAPLQMTADGRKSNSAQIAEGYVIHVVNQFISEQGATSNSPNVELVQRTWFNPNLDYIWFTLPSLAVMITLQICLNVTALSVAREREMGTFEQLLVSPLRPLEIIAGKSIPALILALIEVTIFIFITVFVFHVPFHGSMLFLYLSLTVFITAIIGVGLSISSIAVTQQQAMLGMMAVILTATMLSGYVAPIDNMPDWLRPFTYANPLRYIMIVIKGVFLKDMPPLEILNNTWPMAIIGAFTLSLATWLFKKRLAWYGGAALLLPSLCALTRLAKVRQRWWIRHRSTAISFENTAWKRASAPRSTASACIRCGPQRQRTLSPTIPISPRFRSGLGMLTYQQRGSMTGARVSRKTVRAFG
jgi:ABC-2 type transport system permease protein